MHRRCIFYQHLLHGCCIDDASAIQSMHLSLDSRCIDLKHTMMHLLLNSRCIDAIMHILFNSRMHQCIYYCIVGRLSHRCIYYLIIDASTIVDASSMQRLCSRYIVDASTNQQMLIKYASTMHLLLNSRYIDYVVDASLMHQLLVDASNM